MIRKTIEFSTPGTRLSVAHRQLVVERPDLPKATFPIEDLGVVIVDDTRATYTQSVFLSLLEAGATVLVTGRDHLPAGMMLPLDAHHVQTERHRAQVETSAPVRKRAWQAIVRAKIVQQATVLSHFTGSHGGLVPMARRVRSGDPDNLEAQAAQRYWPRLFGKTFRRDREAEGVNGAPELRLRGRSGRRCPRRGGGRTDSLSRCASSAPRQSVLSGGRSAGAVPPLRRLAGPPNGRGGRRVCARSGRPRDPRRTSFPAQRNRPCGRAPGTSAVSSPYQCGLPVPNAHWR